MNDEIYKLTHDLQKCIQEENYGRLRNILNKISPELKEGLIEYLDKFNTYINRWSDEDPEKEGKLNYFKVLKEIVQKYSSH